MKPDHKIIKTEDPSRITPCKIVSHPAGDCPYYLCCVPKTTIANEGLEDDIIEDTSQFFAGYDLSEQEEDIPSE